MITYILKTTNNEFYCGKTKDLDKRLKEHTEKRNGSWFNFKNRNQFELIYRIEGDFERQIKSFGVKKFIEAIEEGVLL